MSTGSSKNDSGRRRRLASCDNLVGRFAGEFRHVIELEREGADAGGNMALFFMGDAGANSVFCVGLDCNRTSDLHHSFELIIQFSCLEPAMHLSLVPQ